MGMLTERLQTAIKSAAQLPPAAQDELAAQIENAITNAVWDADLADPKNEAWLKEWIEEARQEETVDFPTPNHRPRAMRELHKSRVKRGFWMLFDALSPEIQSQAREAYEQFARDPFSPGLNFEEVNKSVGLWSCRVNDKVRVLGFREADEMLWFWIGTHAEYERRKQRGH